MATERRALGKTTVALLAIIVVLVGSLVVTVISQPAMHTATTTTLTTTKIVSQENHTVTITETKSLTGQSATITYFYSPSVTIPVPCCPSIPKNFVVGSQNVATYGFNVTLAPYCDTCLGGVIMAFKVYKTNAALAPRPQWANFTWPGAIISGENLPSPSNATVFDGAVRMNWFVNSSLLYLHIAIRQAAGSFLGISFSKSWQYVGNDSLSGPLSACAAMRLPCPLNPTNEAEQFTNGTAIIYAEEISGCESGGLCTTYAILISNNSIYCITPKVPWAQLCPSVIDGTP